MHFKDTLSGKIPTGDMVSKQYRELGEIAMISKTGAINILTGTEISKITEQNSDRDMLTA